MLKKLGLKDLLFFRKAEKEYRSRCCQISVSDPIITTTVSGSLNLKFIISVTLLVVNADCTRLATESTLALILK
jgi:hypothetical protein